MPDELNEWLRRVRPPTAADGDGADGNWTGTDEARELLAEVHRRTQKAHAARRARVWTLVPAAAVAIAAIWIVVVASSSAPQQARHVPDELPKIRLQPAAKLLTPFSSCDTLLRDLRAHALAHPTVFEGYSDSHGYAVPVENAPAATAENSSPETSTTNVQEIGVDEPDIVKTDGDRVLTVTDGHLRVIDGSTRQVLSSLDLTMYANWQGAQLLTANDHAIVLMPPSSGYGVVPTVGGPAVGNVPAIGVPPAAARSTVLYIDLAGAPKVAGTMQADGDIVDARMIGSTARLVVSSSPSLNLDLPFGAGQPQLKSVIGKAPLSTWLPSYTLNGGPTKTVPCSQVSHPSDYTAASTVTVYTVNPATPNADPEPVSLEADGNTVYATQTSLYVASNPNCVYCSGAATTGTPGTTQLHRFDITGAGKPTYLGSGSVPGSLLNQYSLSDFDGSLRVATTITTPPTSSPPTSQPASSSTMSNSVYVLDDATLTVDGHVDGLGSGERVYAVRFLGALGYVVTYNQVDPLYVLDLSDPTKPRVEGSLQLDGFSSYLHDIGAGRLVGVGQDTTPVSENGGTYAHLNGLLVQLFDVSNPSKPTRTSRIVLSNTPGQAEFDPHAFLYWPSTGLVVVPVGTWSATDMGKVLAVRVSGRTLVQLGTVANGTGAASGASGQESNNIERSLIVDNALWTLSASGIRVSDQSTLHQLAWIDFG